MIPQAKEDFTGLGKQKAGGKTEDGGQWAFDSFPPSCPKTRATRRNTPEISQLRKMFFRVPARQKRSLD